MPGVTAFPLSPGIILSLVIDSNSAACKYVVEHIFCLSKFCNFVIVNNNQNHKI